MRPFTFDRASAATDAWELHAAASGASYVAGGTTLIDLVKLDVMRPEHIVDINRIGFDEVEILEDGRMRIGAMVRNSDLAWHPEVRRRYPVLAEALLSGASPQLRNMATTGGNLLQRTRCPYFRDVSSACNKREPGAGCAALDGYNRSHAILGGSDACIATHPSDMCVAMAALDAELVLRDAEGERSVPMNDFHLLPRDTPHQENVLRPGELIVAVLLPPLADGTRSWYLKARDRASYEFALASAAVVIRIEEGRLADARVAVGGVATKPWRAREAEDVLRGAPATRDSFQRAAEVAVRDARPRAHNAFKVELLRRVIVRALTEATAGQPSIRMV